MRNWEEYLCFLNNPKGLFNQWSVAQLELIVYVLWSPSVSTTQHPRLLRHCQWYKAGNNDIVYSL